MPDKRLRVSTLFRNGAQIHYEIDRPCRATLMVYDQSGRVVRTLVSGLTRAGSYTAAWDGRDEYGRPAGSGVYFCRLQAGEFTAARKMVKAE
jgi:flagellar hook assembly protein FlgD